MGKSMKALRCLSNIPDLVYAAYHVSRSEIGDTTYLGGRNGILERSVILGCVRKNYCLDAAYRCNRCRFLREIGISNSISVFYLLLILVE